MYTINKKGQSQYTEKRSKFLGYCQKIESVEQYKQLINHYRNIYSDSSHVCGAYRLMKMGQIVDFQSDDGEPRGSAGVPLLNTLKKENLINSAVIVVRYYGGSNLGIPGLIHAYTTTAQDSIFYSKKIKWKIEKKIELIYQYKFNKSIQSVIKQFKASIYSQFFGHEIKSQVIIDSKQIDMFKEELIQITSNQIIIK
tara:strand:+ start:283 stop:873 length:591 start_codon:yes stop_codon:yes gene_type:complete